MPEEKFYDPPFVGCELMECFTLLKGWGVARSGVVERSSSANGWVEYHRLTITAHRTF
jgi:hypothetical protein